MLDNSIPVEAEFTLLRRELAKFKRRGSARYKCGLVKLTTVEIADTGERLEGLISNVSKTGLGVTLPRALDAGTRVAVQVRVTGVPRAFALAGTIVHGTPVSDGSWRVGCQLADALPPELVDALLE
jgi:hypothetical protein